MPVKSDTPRDAARQLRARWRRRQLREAGGSCRSELRMLWHEGRGRCFNLVLVCRRSSGHEGAHRGLCRPIGPIAHGFVATWPAWTADFPAHLDVVPRPVL